jgi:hypothetical protein
MKITSQKRSALHNRIRALMNEYLDESAEVGEDVDVSIEDFVRYLKHRPGKLDLVAETTESSS